jgi:hypothetical protein
MTKRMIVVGLALVLGLGTALAQPAPAPAPTPPDPGGTPMPKEKTGTDENLEQGGTKERPWAVGVSKDQQQAALRLFREGNVHHNDGLFAKAVEVYRQALKSWDHPAIHYNLALSLMQLDDPIALEASLKKASAFGPAPLEKDKFEKIKDFLLLVDKQLATIELSCDKVGAKVYLDRQEIFTVTEGGQNRHKARVRIGKHEMYAEKQGYVSGGDAPFIGPGETFRLDLKLYTADELTRYRRRWNATWMPLVVIGGGAIVGIAGGALAMSAQSSYNDFDAEVARCNEETGMNGGCAVDPALTKMRDSGDTKRMLSYVGYGVAGAAVVTGAVLLYLNRQQAYQITESEYRKEQLLKKQQVTVTPIVAPNMAGAMLHARF